MIHVYGLGNCDTCRRARRWLDARGRTYRFHDVRADGLDPARIDRWVAAVGRQALVNRRSAAWRGLDAAERERAADDAGTRALLAAHPTLLKRPVIETADAVVVGFEPERLAQL